MTRDVRGRPEPVLARVLPGTVRGRLRRQFRLRSLGTLLGGLVLTVVVAVLIRLTDLPGSRLVAWLAAVGIPTALLGASVRQRRRQEAATPLPRAPEHGRSGEVPAPDPRGLTRRRRQLRVELALLVLMAAGVLVLTPWVAMTDDARDATFGLPKETAWLWGPLVAVIMSGDARTTWRSLRRIAAVDVGSLPVTRVTVLGFAGLAGTDVVFVPGVVSPQAALDVLAGGPADPTPAGDAATQVGGSELGGSELGGSELGGPELGGSRLGGPVFMAPVGAALGELVAGDVLVCHGPLEAHGLVHLANAGRGTWIHDLRIPDRSTIFRDPLPGGEVRDD